MTKIDTALMILLIVIMAMAIVVILLYIGDDFYIIFRFTVDKSVEIIKQALRLVIERAKYYTI